MAQEKDPAETKPVRPMSRGHNKLFLYAVTAMSAVGGLLFGYDTGVVSGAMIFMTPQLHLDHLWTELIVSITIGIAYFFALIGGPCQERFGRKPIIMLGAIICAGGSIMIAVAKDKYVIVVGRAILGLAMGLASQAVPVYISEVSPPEMRGKLNTLTQMFISGGQLVANVVAGIFSYYPDWGWRAMTGLAAVPAMIQFVGFIFLPESPRWLTKKGHTERARAVLEMVRDPETDDIDEEINGILATCQEKRRSRASIASTMSKSGAPPKTTGMGLWLIILKTPHVRRALVIGCFLQAISQLCGINTIMYYTATVIKMAGVEDETTAIWLSTASAAFIVSATIISFFVVEKMGRRILFLLSCAGVCVGLALIAVAFQMSDKYSLPSLNNSNLVVVDRCATYTRCGPCTNDPDCGFCDIEYNGVKMGLCVPVNGDDQTSAKGGTCTREVFGNLTVLDSNSTIEGPKFHYTSCPLTDKTLGYMIMLFIAICFYLLAFGCGVAPLSWTINSEIYPLWARSNCFALATSFHWSCNFLISMTFLSLSQAITKHGAFYLYCAIAIGGWIFGYLMLPETGGRSLEENEQLFKLSRKRRVNLKRGESLLYENIQGTVKPGGSFKTKMSASGDSNGTQGRYNEGYVERY